MSDDITIALRAKDTTGKAFDSVIRSVKTLDVGLKALAGGYLFKEIVSGATETASAFEQLEKQLNTLTKGKGVETLSELNKWALDMPVDTLAAVDSFKMMQSFGLEPTIEKMEILTNVSSIFGQDAMPSVSRALGQMTALTKLSAEELNQLAEVGINAREILAKAFDGASVEELQKRLADGEMEISQIVDAIWKGLDTNYSGAAKSAMDSWQGLTATFSSYLKEIQRVVMDWGIFEYMKKSLGEVNDMMKFSLEVINPSDADKQMAEIHKLNNEIVATKELIFELSNTEADLPILKDIAEATKKLMSELEKTKNAPILPQLGPIGELSSFGFFDEFLSTSEDAKKKLEEQIKELEKLNEIATASKMIDPWQKKIISLDGAIDRTKELGEETQKLNDKLLKQIDIDKKIAEFNRDQKVAITDIKGQKTHIEPGVDITQLPGYVPVGKTDVILDDRFKSEKMLLEDMEEFNRQQVENLESRLANQKMFQEKSIAEWEKGFDTYKKELEKTTKETDKQAKEMLDIYKMLGVSIVNSMGSALKNVVSGTMETKDAVAGVISSAAQVGGRVVGTSYGGPVGGAIGDAVGSVAGGFIEKFSAGKEKIDWEPVINSIEGLIDQLKNTEKVFQAGIVAEDDLLSTLKEIRELNLGRSEVPENWLERIEKDFSGSAEERAKQAGVNQLNLESFAEQIGKFTLSISDEFELMRKTGGEEGIKISEQKKITGRSGLSEKEIAENAADQAYWQALKKYWNAIDKEVKKVVDSSQNLYESFQESGTEYERVMDGIKNSTQENIDFLNAIAKETGADVSAQIEEVMKNGIGAGLRAELDFEKQRGEIIAGINDQTTQSDILIEKYAELITQMHGLGAGADEITSIFAAADKEIDKLGKLMFEQYLDIVSPDRLEIEGKGVSDWSKSADDLALQLASSLGVEDLSEVAYEELQFTKDQNDILELLLVSAGNAEKLQEKMSALQKEQLDELNSIAQSTAYYSVSFQAARDELGNLLGEIAKDDVSVGTSQEWYINEYNKLKNLVESPTNTPMQAEYYSKELSEFVPQMMEYFNAYGMDWKQVVESTKTDINQIIGSLDRDYGYSYNPATEGQNTGIFAVDQGFDWNKNKEIEIPVAVDSQNTGMFAIDQGFDWGPPVPKSRSRSLTGKDDSQNNEIVDNLKLIGTTLTDISNQSTNLKIEIDGNKIAEAVFENPNNFVSRMLSK